MGILADRIRALAEKVVETEKVSTGDEDDELTDSIETLETDIDDWKDTVEARVKGENKEEEESEDEDEGEEEEDEE